MPLNSTCECPAITSVMACAPPLYGMNTQSTPARLANKAAARCGALPAPEVAALKPPALPFDAATSSANVFTGTLLVTTTRCGE